MRWDYLSCSLYSLEVDRHNGKTEVDFGFWLGSALNILYLTTLFVGQWIPPYHRSITIITGNLPWYKECTIQSPCPVYMFGVHVQNPSQKSSPKSKSKAQSSFLLHQVQKSWCWLKISFFGLKTTITSIYIRYICILNVAYLTEVFNQKSFTPETQASKTEIFYIVFFLISPK